MAPVRPILVGLMVATTALAGCFGGDELPTRYTVQASGGSVSDGWAYDGQDLVSAGATVDGNVDVEADAGVLNVTFEAWNSTWSATLDSFSGSEAFMGGGIAQEIRVHGDTGQASTAIPAIDLELGTWGTATLLRDGEPYAIGPDGADGAWFAHLMLSKDTVRGPDGLIAQENATGPYDPAQPTNGRVIEDDAQGILELIAPSGEDAARAPQNVSESASFQGPGSSQAFPLPTTAYSSATVRVSTSGAQNIQVGDVQVSIVDENGTVLAEGSGQVTPNSGFNQTWTLDGLSGPTTVEVRGNGTYDVNVDARVTYDDHSFVVVTWDDYALEPR